MRLLKENKHVWAVLAFGIFHLISYFALESSDVPVNIIQCELDEKIPFCEYFIIPYVLWYVFIGGTLCYFCFICKHKEEFYRLIVSLCLGMLTFIIVSFVYPNGHALRPELTGNGIFINAVRLLYKIDTSTNILPSLHVYEAVVCCAAILKNAECRKKKMISIASVILTVLIILSTVFLKQHTIIDVIAALGLNIVCYQIVYKWAVENWSFLAKLFTKKEICTIPNLLSMFRLVLAVLILGISQRYGMNEKRSVLMGLLILSAVTDFLDGKIARKYHMVSEVGKILDPVADKVTQGVLLLCFLKMYPVVKPLFLLFLIKEICMVVIGTRTVLKTQKNEGAMWYGKVNTAIFYGTMVLLVINESMPMKAANILLLLCGVSMLLTLILYMRQYRIKLENLSVKEN